MKKLMKSLLVAALTISASNMLAAADCNPCSSSSSSCGPCGDNANKTYLMARPHGSNLALEYTDGWRGFLYKKHHHHEEGHHHDGWKGTSQVAFFYEESTNGDKIGRYFSPKHTSSDSSSSAVITRACSSTCDSSSSDCCGECAFTFGSYDFETPENPTANTITEDLNYRSFIHFPDPDEGPREGGDVKFATMGLKMTRKSYGFLFNHHQSLDKVVKGLFFTASAPIVHVENNIECCIIGEDVAFSESTEDNITAANVKAALEAYFNGDTVNLQLGATAPFTDNGIRQERLRKDLIPCKKVAAPACPTDCSSDSSCKPNHSRTGVADIDVRLGYQFLCKKEYRANVTFGVTVPTGNKPHEKTLWEPMIGNGRHWAVGFGLYGDYCAWHNIEQKQSLVLMAALDYRYLLKDNECRKLGFCGQQWGHFRLLGKKGQTLLVPAANILVQNVDVTPGSQIDFIAQMNFTHNGFGVDLGYNLYYRDEEEISFKKCGCILDEGTYAFPSKEYSGESAFGSVAGDFESDTADDYLTDAALDKSVAETPSQLSHKIYGGLSYRWTTKWHVPCLVGVGGHYEFAGSDAALETWGVNVKAGISF